MEALPSIVLTDRRQESISKRYSDLCETEKAHERYWYAIRKWAIPKYSATGARDGLLLALRRAQHQLG